MLAKNIKEKRLNIGLTQKELAKKVNLTPSTICDAEHGRINLSINKIKCMAKIFNCTVDELVN